MLDGVLAYSSGPAKTNFNSGLGAGPMNGNGSLADDYPAICMAERVRRCRDRLIPTG